MEATIEFIEIVENVTLIIEDVTDDVSFEVFDTIEVVTLVFEELGVPGLIGKSNYEIAVDNGFIGTEQQWLDSQNNIDGGLIF